MNTHREFTFEIEETIVVRDGAPSMVFCGQCLREVPMITPKTAAALSGMSEREIFRLVESELLHFSENPCVLICLESLSAMGKTPPAASLAPALE